MEVAHQDRHLGAGHDEDTKDQEKEPKDIIDLVEPDRVQDKVELNKDRAEGQDASNEHRGDRTEVEDLVGDLARDLVGTDGVLDLRALESEV